MTFAGPVYLAELANSLFASLGLRGVDNSLSLPDADRVCLLLVDGLGEISLNEYLHVNPEKLEVNTRSRSTLPAIAKMKSLRDERQLTSHFPTTTATNLASIGTGLFPAEHAMLGYTVRVPNTDRLLNALKWDERVDPFIWQSNETLHERARSQGISTSHIAEKRFEGTGFTRATSRGATYLGANRIDDLLAQAKIAHKSAPSFSMVYVNWVDHAGHSDGVGSEKWLSALRAVDNLVDRLMNTLPAKTHLYLTADHGMINAGEKIVIGQDNPLAESVELIGGEARARHLYVAEGKIDHVRATWERELASKVEIFSKSDAVEIFAESGGEVGRDAIARMGDLIIVPRGEVVLLDPAIADKEGQMVGHHGALTELERAIPLLHAYL